jgi:hypothetical protein
MFLVPLPALSKQKEHCSQLTPQGCIDMFVIRRQQMEIFSACALTGFEDRMASYIAKKLPHGFGANNELAIRELIRKGIDRARGYGIAIEYDVARFIELMQVLSEDFDTSPAFPWAAPILTNGNLDSREKMDRLVEKAALDPRYSTTHKTLEKGN